MINLLELKHFKCFNLLKLPLGNLTVLSGTNASGKSSTLQALALLHQTMRDHEWSGHIALNGNDVQLGTVSDVVDQAHGRDRFEVGLSDDDIRCNWAFAGERRDMSARLERVDVGDESVEILQRLGNLPEFDDVFDMKTASGEDSITRLRYLLPDPTPINPEMRLAAMIRDLAYITAERIGPRETYPLIEERKKALSAWSHDVGTRGEYTVSALFNGSDEQVSEHLRLKDVAPTLARQVEARMDTFFPGCAIELTRVTNANAVVLGIRTSENTGFLRPAHSGFGVTQILPIVVAVLSASTSTVQRTPLLMIENPEVHLHPSGQALMGEFLAEAAHAGIQIIAETHSDHVLNGVRRAVRSGKAQADAVAIHFFQDRFKHESQVLSPMLDQSGNIDVWPGGFFDQFDKDLDYFAGWGE